MSQLAAPARRESTDDRRLAIAEAARQLIVEKGMEGLRTRDIADRVGINIATLHYHVPSKAALIALVTETMKAEFRAQSLHRPRAHLPAAEQLEHEFADFREMLTEKRELLALMSELLGRARRDETVRLAVEPLLRRWHEMIAAILAAGVADGSFRADLDPEPGAALVIGALTGHAITPANYPQLCAELRRALYQVPSKAMHQP